MSKRERKWVLRSVFIVLLALVGWFVVKAKRAKPEPSSTQLDISPLFS